MGTNLYQGQICGPFNANEEIFNLISNQCVSRPQYVLHLGIQSDTDNVVLHPKSLIQIINNDLTQTYEIGKTGIYEVGNTKITSIKFLNDRDNNTIIDYTVVL